MQQLRILNIQTETANKEDRVQIYRTFLVESATTFFAGSEEVFFVD